VRVVLSLLSRVKGVDGCLLWVEGQRCMPNRRATLGSKMNARRGSGKSKRLKAGGCKGLLAEEGLCGRVSVYSQDGNPTKPLLAGNQP